MESAAERAQLEAGAARAHAEEGAAIDAPGAAKGLKNLVDPYQRVWPELTESRAGRTAAVLPVAATELHLVAPLCARYEHARSG
jgi:hypothetical protein